MSVQAGFLLKGRNPDVLTCIANLSNDEVFTPPEFANRMLDTLAEAWAADNKGASLWEDSSVRFLDPCTKSGVFLREITRRLTKGLENEIPDLKARVDHILTEQVFGIGITYLTSMLARRSVYCSKHAKGEHSIGTTFTTDKGNIWFERTEHSWSDGKCTYCGAPREIFDREIGMENHAYSFLHSNNIKSYIEAMFGGFMQFDVIIGNPPYQMTGGAGGSSDSSIYHLFVRQAQKLGPRYLSMVIPSRWMAGGRGLDEFRKEMLTGRHLIELIDWNDSGEAFPGVQIKGGICYFLWSRDYIGDCRVARISSGETEIQAPRDLSEFDVFIRDERSLSILRKVLAKREKSILDLISGDTPFGIATNFLEWAEKPSNGYITLHLIAKTKRVIGYIKRSVIKKNMSAIDSWKVLLPEAYGAGESFPHQILGKFIVASPPAACSQSYLTAWPFTSEKEAVSFSSYYSTKFFRFLVSLRKITQHALRSTYSWVPLQEWDQLWTDEMLYKKYSITGDEIAFINSMIRPMGEDGSDD